MHRSGLRYPKGSQPGALGQAQIGTTLTGRIEHRELTGDLIGMQRVGIPAGSAKADPVRGLGDLQQCRKWWLIEQVTEDADDVESTVFGECGQLRIFARCLVRLQSQPDLGTRKA